VSTEDGSSGSKGMVTDLLPRFFEDVSPVTERNLSLFACGPLAMLRALSEFAQSRKVPCQVSLESRMACGVGACVGCSIPTQTDGSTLPTYQRACKEGPVFESSVILWNDPHLSTPMDSL
jgi:dihydroorotate dehydrogenase electron transfer subunit